MKTNFIWKGFFIGLLFLFNIGNVAFGQLDSLLEVVQTLPDGEEKIMVYKDIAFSYYNMNPDKCLEYGDTLEVLSQKENFPLGEGYAHYCRSLAYYIKGNNDKALEYANKSAKILLDIGTVKAKLNTATLYDFIGTLLLNQSDYNQAVEYYYKSLKINEELQDTLNLTYNYNNLGQVFYTIGDLEKSKKYYFECIKLSKSLGLNSTLATVYSSLGNLEEKPQEKLSFLDTAYSYTSNETNEYYLIGIYENYANAYSLLKNWEKSLEYSFKSLELAEKIKTPLYIGKVSVAIGDWYSQIGKQDSAIYFLRKGIKILEENNISLDIGNSYVTLGKHLAKHGNYKEAFFFMEKGLSIQDSTLNSEITKQIEVNSAKYEFEKNQRTIAEQQLQISETKNNRNQIIILAIALLAIIAGIYQWYLYRQRQKEKDTKVALVQQQAEAERLRELDQLKSNFFTNLSHELRTPLTLILSPVSDAIETAKSNPLKNKLKIVQANAQKLLNLVNEIMDLSKAEVGKLSVNTASIALVPFVKRLFSAFESLAEIRKIDFKLNIDLDEATTVRLDLEKFEKIINNLLSNALKYTNANGSVSMNVQQADNNFIFEVSDTGKGIHVDDQPHIFNRFYQAKQGNEPLQGGTGVGLALSKELAKLLGGNITFSSEVNQGSTFTFAVPLEIVEMQTAVIEEETIVETAVLPFVPTYQPFSINGEKPRLLIVEDNLEMSNYLVEILSADYQCSTAVDGQEALKQLKLYSFDCITSDVMMPNMDGFELRNAINKNKEWKQIPFLLLTARYLESDKLKGFQLGIDDYITKPFSTKELQARIHNLISNKIERDNFIKSEQQPNEATGIRLSVDQDLLQVCEQIILENLDKTDFKVDNLAKKVNYSSKQLGRTIKKLTGLSTVGFILEVRLQKARELLEKGLVATVIEAQMEVGISSTSYFTRKFTERFGKNPKSVRM